MSDALEEHDGKVSIDGRNITNLYFADDAIAEKEQEPEALIESLDKTCTGVRRMPVLSRPKWGQTAQMASREIITGYRCRLQVHRSSLFQMMAQNLRLAQALHKPLQLLNS